MRIKKLKLVMLCGLFCIIVFTGCEKAVSVDPLSQRVIDKIDALGEIGLDDVESIDSIKEEYNSLTDNQKDQVTNYIIVVEAEETIEKMKEDVASKEPESYIIYACNVLKASMKNPDSFKIDRIEYTPEIYNQGKYDKLFSSLNCRTFIISYSGENSFGGISTSEAYGFIYSDGSGKFVDSSEYNTNEVKMGRAVHDDGLTTLYEDVDFIMSMLD